jgi:hypothetical protein
LSRVRFVQLEGHPSSETLSHVSNDVSGVRRPESGVVGGAGPTGRVGGVCWPAPAGPRAPVCADRQGRERGAEGGLSLVAGMVAGADSIDDMALLRHGGMRRVFTSAYAPPTLGSFLRAFTGLVPLTMARAIGRSSLVLVLLSGAIGGRSRRIAGSRRSLGSGRACLSRRGLLHRRCRSRARGSRRGRSRSQDSLGSLP